MRLSFAMQEMRWRFVIIHSFLSDRNQKGRLSWDELGDRKEGRKKKGVAIELNEEDQVGKETPLNEDSSKKREKEENEHYLSLLIVISRIGWIEGTDSLSLSKDIPNPSLFVLMIGMRRKFSWSEVKERRTKGKDRGYCLDWRVETDFTLYAKVFEVVQSIDG